MTDVEWYFAYGSNMSPSRLGERGVQASARRWGVLEGWRLVFDKRAYRDPTEAYANLVPDSSSQVEGVLYALDAAGLAALDDREGAPKHYTRRRMAIRTRGEPFAAWVYIATKPWRSQDVLPSVEYLHHIVDGSDLLSDQYRQGLVRELEAARQREIGPDGGGSGG